MNERVLECAKEEFLLNGYKDASLRTIAKNAETSTGSIYTRFGDKQGLFKAIMEPVVQEMRHRFIQVQEDFHKMDEEQQMADMKSYSAEGMRGIVIFMYEHFNEFYLLLDASYGTEFQNFVDEMVDIEVSYTYKYMETIGCESVKSGLVTEDFIHIVTTAYFNGVFEIIRHQLDKDAALRYVDMLGKYHIAGFDTIFSPMKD